MNGYTEQTQRKLSDYFDAYRSIEGPGPEEIDAIVAREGTALSRNPFSTAVRNLVRRPNIGIGHALGITSLLIASGVGAVLLLKSPHATVKVPTRMMKESRVEALPKIKIDPPQEGQRPDKHRAITVGPKVWLKDSPRTSITHVQVEPIMGGTSSRVLDAEEGTGINADFPRDHVSVSDYSLYSVSNVESLNSADLDYSPSITSDGQTLYFVSDRLGGEGGHDVWSAAKSDPWSEDFGPPVNIGPPINTELNEGVTAISSDGSTMYFTACNRPDGVGDCDIYEARFDGTTWHDIRNVREINSTSWESRPSLSGSGDTLYFISNRPGVMGGDDDADIYRSVRTADGSWEAPVNLGAPINTPQVEDSPFILPGTGKLFFSSQGHGGYGGLDFFVSTQDENGRWSTPENLGPVFNTKMDEQMLAGTADESVFYFSSLRTTPKNFGKFDIFMAVRSASSVEIETMAEPKSALEIGISPNPATDVVNLAIMTDRPIDGDVVIVDQQGREVRRLSIREIDLPIPISDLPAGLYFVRAGMFSGSFVVRR